MYTDNTHVKKKPHKIMLFMNTYVLIIYCFITNHPKTQQLKSINTLFGCSSAIWAQLSQAVLLVSHLVAGRSAGAESAGAQDSWAFSLHVVLGLHPLHVATTHGMYMWSLRQAGFLTWWVRAPKSAKEEAAGHLKAQTWK